MLSRTTLHRIFSCLFAAAITVLAGCETTIPAMDAMAPRVELRIAGPVVGNQSMSNPPRETWTGAGGIQYLNLQPDTRYQFTLIVTDSGGAARAFLSFPQSFELVEVTPGGVVETLTGVARQFTLRGDRSNPRSALSISGYLETGGGNMSFTFSCEGDDYGGTSGPRNQTFLVVESFVELPRP